MKENTRSTDKTRTAVVFQANHWPFVTTFVSYHAVSNFCSSPVLMLKIKYNVSKSDAL